MKIRILLLMLVLVTRFTWAAENAHCIDDVFHDLNNLAVNKSDPTILIDVIRHELQLDGIDEVIRHFDNNFRTPKDLRPLVDAIIRGVKQNNALSQMLCNAHSHGHLKSVDWWRLVHRVFVLNEFIPYLLQDIDFFSRLHHIVKQRKEHIDPYGKAIHQAETMSRGFYGMRRESSIDDIINSCHTALKKGSVDKKHAKAIRDSFSDALCVQIINEWVPKYRDNAIAALALTATSPHVKITEHPEIHFDVDQEWINLFQVFTWTFLTTVPNCQLVFASLLAPYLTNSLPKDYLLRYELAVWLSFNGVVLSSKCHDFCTPFFVNPTTIESHFGHLTEQLAFEYLQTHAENNSYAKTLLHRLKYEREETNLFLQDILTNHGI